MRRDGVPRSLVTTWLATMLVCVAACAPDAPAPKQESALEQMLRSSRETIEARGIAAATGLDPIADYFIALHLKRAAEKPDSADLDRPLVLAGVRELSARQLDTLADCQHESVFLPDLPRIEPAAAARLARPGRQLFLDGLVSIDSPLARTLGNADLGLLSLGGLRSLGIAEGEVAVYLATSRGSLRLARLEKASPVVLERLAEWRGWGEGIVLSLGGLRTLTRDQAAAIARCEGWGVELDGLEELTPEIATELGKLDTPFLSLDGLTTISRETARVMSTWKRKFLSLRRVRTGDAEVRSLVEAGSVSVVWAATP